MLQLPECALKARSFKTVSGNMQQCDASSWLRAQPSSVLLSKDCASSASRIHARKLSFLRLRGPQLLTGVASCEGEAEGRAMTRARLPSSFHAFDTRERA